MLATVLLLARADGWALPGAEQTPVDLAVGLTYAVTGALVLGAAAGPAASASWAPSSWARRASAGTALSAGYAVTATSTSPGLAAAQLTSCLRSPASSRC